MMKSIITATILTFILLFSFTPSALAQGPDDGDKWVFGSNLTLSENEVVDGDLVVFGGNVTIPESASVSGDMVVLGGNATVIGKIDGDIMVMGGNANLQSTSVVGGSINAFGGNINQAEGASVEGSVDELGGEEDDDPEIHFPIHSNTSYGFAGRVASFFINTTWNIFLLLALGALGWLVAAFLPDHMQTVGDTISQAAPLSFGMGLLTMILVAILSIPMVLLIITICLAIVPIAVYLLLGVAILFGWIVIGQLLGERVMGALDRPLASFTVSTAVGVIIITAITNMPIIEAIPVLGTLFSFLGGLIGILIALTGLGAVVLTRYGTRPYLATGPSFNTTSTTYTPYTPPTPPPSRSTDFSREERAEAELKARIKAALAEAEQDEGAEAPQSEPDEPASEPKKKPPKPKKKPDKPTPTDENGGADDKPEA